MEITFKTKAWLSKNSDATPADLRTPKGAADLHYSPYDMGRFGDTYIGEATITVEVPDERTLIDNKVEALREEVKATRAEATAKVTKLEGQIQQLLAIEFKPTPA